MALVETCKTSHGRRVRTARAAYRWPAPGENACSLGSRSHLVSCCCPPRAVAAAAKPRLLWSRRLPTCRPIALQRCPLPRLLQRSRTKTNRPRIRIRPRSLIPVCERTRGRGRSALRRSSPGAGRVVSTNPAASEQTIRAAAATLVVLQGSSVELGTLLAPAAAERQVQGLQRSLCTGSREERARILSSILTSIAIDLGDWGLR